MENIKTWQERGNWPQYFYPPYDGLPAWEAAKAEIADLRAALESRATTEPSDLAAAILALPLPEPTIEGSVMHTELKICYRAPIHFTADQMRDLLTAAAALAKQVPAQEQAKIDAQRYRWLRDQDIHTQVGSFTPYAVEVIQGQTNKMLDGKELDEACDKAIAAQLAQSADKAEGDHG